MIRRCTRTAIPLRPIATGELGREPGDIVTEHPNRQTAIRAAAASVPWIGGAITEIWFGHRDRTKQRRLAAFLDDIADRLRNIDEAKVDKDYIGSEDFVDFLDSVLDRATRVRADDRRARLSRALCEQITRPIPIDFADLFLDLVLELNSSQVHILKEHAQGSPNRSSSSFRTPRHYSLRQGHYRYLVQVLISRGLMLEQHVPKTGVGEKYRPFERLEVTELGLEFLKFLEHEDGRISC